MELRRKNKASGDVSPAASGLGRRSAAKLKPKASQSSGAVGKSKGKRFVFIIGDEGAILVFMQGTKVVRRLFAPSAQPSHTEAIREIMSANSNVPIYVLADVIDQQYIPHSFPPVSSLSVGGLVKRRLDRDFQPEDLKGSLQLGRDKAGRKEWKYLLISLAKTSLISDWIDLLVELPNEMKGVYLVPVEAVNYVAMLGKKLSSEKPRPWQLLISHNKVSGFRQVVIRDGKLVFTRVSQAIDDAIPAVIAGNVEQEIINTMEYLKRLEFRDNADLEATVVISQDVGELIDLKRFGFGRAQVLSPMNVAEALGLEQAALSADRFGDVVMACAFGISKKRVLRFSTAYMDKLAKLYQLRAMLRAAGGLGVMLFVGLAAMSVFGMVGNYSSIGEAERKTSALQADLEKFKKSVDGLNKDVAFKSAIVATYDAYIKDVPTYQAFIKDLAPLVSPRYRVLSVDWAYKGDAATTPGAPPPASAVQAKVEFDLSGAGTTPDELTRAINELLENIKTKLPQYEVKPEAFPWQKEETKEEEVSLEVNQEALLSPQKMIAVINFTLGKAGAAAPPGSPPPGQVP